MKGMKMSPVRLIVLGAVAIAVLVAYLFGGLIQTSTPSEIALVIIIAIATAFLAGTFAYFLCVRTMYPKTMLVAEQGEVVAVFPYYRHFWRWDRCLKGVTDLSYALETRWIAMKPSAPITANPKVRAMTYQVRVGAFGTPEARAAFMKAGYHSSWDIASLVENHLYEFNEQESQEMAKFYNPLNKEQQRAFEALVRAFLGPRLQNSGVTFQSAHFALA